MPELALTDLHNEQSRNIGAYELIRNLDKNVRDLHSELYILRRENERRFSHLDSEVQTLKKDTAQLQHDNTVIKNEISELKQEVKELRRDVSDIKGDIRAIAAGFGAAQNRFNWGLIILGLFVALIQLLK